MNHKYVTIYLFSVFLFLSLGFANATEPPAAPILAAKAYLLKDFNSGKALAEKASDKRVEPASLTKVMTAYLCFKALKSGDLKLDQNVPVSVKAWQTQGSKMFVEPKTPVTVDELLHGMIIQSGNDASVALAEAIAGDETTFAELMNKEALAIGMKDTHFVNATGLPDPQHYTTAKDLAILAGALIREFPDQYKRLYSQKEYTYNKITQPNRNRLLWLDPYVDGMKTGHTESAGYCLISSANRDQTRLISVVLGTASEAARASESQKLLNYGFQFFESHKVYQANQKISEFRVWKGAENTLKAGVPADLYLSVPKGQFKAVKAVITSRQPLLAPIKKGQEVGTLQFMLDGKLIDQHPLLANEDVPIAGIFGRMIDSMRLMLQ